MLRNEYYNCDCSYLHIGYSSSYNWVTSIFCLFHNPLRRPREGILEMNLCTLCREAEHFCLLVFFFFRYIKKHKHTFIYFVIQVNEAYTNQCRWIFALYAETQNTLVFFFFEIYKETQTYIYLFCNSGKRSLHQSVYIQWSIKTVFNALLPHFRTSLQIFSKEFINCLPFGAWWYLQLTQQFSNIHTVFFSQSPTAAHDSQLGLRSDVQAENMKKSFNETLFLMFGFW